MRARRPITLGAADTLKLRQYRGLAQLAERRANNTEDGGSIPCAPDPT